jgi:hypothetical protein
MFFRYRIEVLIISNLLNSSSKPVFLQNLNPASRVPSSNSKSLVITLFQLEGSYSVSFSNILDVSTNFKFSSNIFLAVM